MITTKKPTIERLDELTEATMTDAQRRLYDKIASGPRKGVAPLALAAQRRTGGVRTTTR
ncbi:hypothetical protein CDEF62S_02154 [Castellaniella defragrans]